MKRQHLIHILMGIACIRLLAKVEAVVPAPDGGYPGGNTAEGQAALLSLTTGSFNTAVGFFSLRSDTMGRLNTAVGAGTLLANTADGNTATGAGALFGNTTGTGNTANGAFALVSDTTGGLNTAVGQGALQDNTTGNSNTACGGGTLVQNTGNDNTAVGFQAGLFATTGDSNVYIGAGMQGVAGESNACYIASIFGQTSANGVAVLINSSNKLGTATSSKRFKEGIKPMDKASKSLFELKPVTFRYKKEIDPAGTSQFGLVAEEVEKVNPDLVVCDKEGKPYSVRYDQVNAMLLNEFLKEHRRNEEQEATIAKLKKEMETVVARLKEHDSQIQKVSTQIEISKAVGQTALNSP